MGCTYSWAVCWLLEFPRQQQERWVRHALLFNATSTWGYNLQLPGSTENHRRNFWMFWRRVIHLGRALYFLPDPFSALLWLNISPGTDASQTQSHASWMASLEIIAFTGIYIIPYSALIRYDALWKTHLTNASNKWAGLALQLCITLQFRKCFSWGITMTEASLAIMFGLVEALIHDNLFPASSTANAYNFNSN